MVNWDINRQRQQFEMCMENYREYRRIAVKELNNGERKEYYICRDLARVWLKEARDCRKTIRWLEENNYG